MKKKYRKRPVEIEAVQWLGDNQLEIGLFVGMQLEYSIPPPLMEFDREDIPNSAYIIRIPTLEGTMVATRGDFIIKGIHGEFYPCKPEIFEKTYEEVKE